MIELDTLKRRRDFLLELDDPKDDEIVRARGKIISDISDKINNIESNNDNFKEFEVIKSNGLIDLKRINEKEYMIFLANTNIAVGHLKYSGYHCSYKFGDISYYIYSEHRGNNYAYYALCLLSDKLKEDGVADFWISTKNNNIASIKTIEKYNGKLISSHDGILLFDCLTKKLEDNKHKSI